MEVTFLDMNKDSKEAQEAKKYSRAFQSYDDPNFWVGFCLWMARQPHEELLKIYHEFKAEVVELFPDMKDRLRCFCAVVMTGLHFFERLAEELGVSMEEVVLIKMDTVIGIINDRMKRNYDDKLLNPVLKSYYDAGMENPDDALVLAPNGYRVNGIRYAFDLKKLLERGLGKIRELRPQK